MKRLEKKEISNDDKRMQSIGSIGTYAHGMSIYLSYKKEKIKRVSIKR